MTEGLPRKTIRPLSYDYGERCPRFTGSPASKRRSTSGDMRSQFDDHCSADHGPETETPEGPQIRADEETAKFCANNLQLFHAKDVRLRRDSEEIFLKVAELTKSTDCAKRLRQFVDSAHCNLLIKHPAICRERLFGMHASMHAYDGGLCQATGQVGRLSTRVRDGSSGRSRTYNPVNSRSLRTRAHVFSVG